MAGHLNVYEKKLNRLHELTAIENGFSRFGEKSDYFYLVNKKLQQKFRPE